MRRFSSKTSLITDLLSSSVLLFVAAGLSGCDPRVGDDTAGPPADTDTDTDTDADTDTDTDTDSDTDTDTDADVNYTVVATTTDYTTGALVTLSKDGVLTDSVLPVSSDAAVRTIGNSVYVLNRSTENTVQRFDNLNFSAPGPGGEFSTGDSSNPVDVVECNGSVVVSLYATDGLGVYDRSTGLQTGSVDLSAFADRDGSPEPDSMFVAPNGYLYVAMNQLEFYVSADGSGTLAKVDCSTWQVVDSWDVGPNPLMQADPFNADGVVLTGGNFFNADYSGPDLDGGLYTFDTSDDILTGPLLTEADLGYNLGGIVGSDGYLVSSINDGSVWSLLCIDVSDWSMVTKDLGNAYIGSMAATPEGSIWAAVGYGYGSSGATPDVGFVPVDAAGCTTGAAVLSALAPSSIAVSVQP